jgi:hypothetical protein
MSREPRTSNLEPVRNYIRTHLARSLSSATPEDRLAAAWTVAAGRAMAGRALIAAYDPGTASVRIRVADSVWLQQMTALRATLIRDLTRFSGVPVTNIHFELERPKQPRIARISTD